MSLAPGRSERQFRQVWECSLDAMRLTSRSGIILMANEAYCRLVGRPRHVVEGRPFSANYAEAERAEAESLHERLFAARIGEAGEARQIRLWDGRPVHLEFTSSFLDVPGEPPAMLAIIRDVSARVALEARLLHSQKMDAVGRLAGGVAHDFNNLLTAMNGYSELVYTALPADSIHRGYLTEVIKAGMRAAELTRQLLAFSRKQVLAPVVMNLNDVVADMGALLRRLLGAGVELSIVPCTSPWLVKADPGAVEQVIVNLAVNARDAMPHGGRLTMETRNVRLDEHYVATQPDARPGPHVLLAVTDTGCGMDAATMTRAFEPFFTTKGEGGTGLGLATVYGVLKQSGGHVSVYSEPGRGTTFRAYLPRAEGQATGSSSHMGLPLPGGTETVLLAEDDPAIRALAEQVLESCGYTVLSVGDGREALAVADAHPGPIGLLVTDVVMPRMGGGELAETLAARRPGLKVLFLSGYADSAVVRHGVLNEGALFLHKPFTLAALARKAREALDGPGAVRG